MALSRQKQNQMIGCCPELQAFVEGVELAAGFHYECWEFESPFLNFHRLLGTEKLRTWMETFAERVSRLRWYQINIVCEEANKAARALAQFSKLNECTLWEQDIPNCIADIVVAEHPACFICGRPYRSVDQIKDHANFHKWALYLISHHPHKWAP